MKTLRIVLLITLAVLFCKCKKSLIEENEVANNKLIEKALESNNIDYIKENGIYTYVLKKGYGYQLADGDSIAFWYIASTLKGEIFDTNISQIADSTGIDMQGRNMNPIEAIVGDDTFIQGLTLGLPLCREGQWNSLLFSSTYGYQDIRTGSVEPWSPLVFNVFIIYVKNEKIALEQNNISNFVAGSSGFIPDSTGLWIKSVSQGELNAKPMPGDTIFGAYKLLTLEQSLIEQTEGESEMIVLNNNILEGILYGFLKLAPGDEMHMVIPSPLGYGINGSENIAPYTPLFCEIKLDSIK